MNDHSPQFDEESRMEDSKWVKWEPVLGQVPPDGCEFILKRHADIGRWPLWADTSNRAILTQDIRDFSFRIPVPSKENPMVIKYFTFEERPEAVKEYKTLADVPEGVRCVTTHDGYGFQMVRMRDGSDGVTNEGACPTPANQYSIIQILDPLPVPQLPATMLEAEECRMYVNGAGRHVFKSGEWAYQLGHLTLNSSGLSYKAYFLTSDSYYMENTRITSATNTYAVPCSQEVK